MPKVYLLLAFLFMTSLVSAQGSLLTPYYCDFYSVDHFTGDVYFETLMSVPDGFTGIVLKFNPATQELKETALPSFPVFANKSHTGVVYDYEHRDVYLYDFETKSKTLLIDSAMVETTEGWPYVGAFSPNDRKLALGDYEYNFSTGKLYERSTIKNRNKVLWSSDSSLIIYNLDRNIYQYYPDSRRVDTLVAYQDFHSQISDISYNSKINKLFYSTLEFPYNVLLHMFDVKTGKDSVIYDMIKEEVKPFSKNFISMSWSPDEKMLGFIGLYATQSDADLYVYRTDSAKVFRLTNISDNAGRKYFLQWLDNKSFIFKNTTAGHILYSYTIPSSITRVEGKKEAPDSYSLSNYPNPFNPATTINYQIPHAGKVMLKVYDMLGKELATLVNEYKSQGQYSVRFNAGDLPSGMYLYTLRANDFTKSGKMLLLK